MTPRASLYLHGVRALARSSRLFKPARSQANSLQVRGLVSGPPWSGGSDPFRQMECLMRDMDRKLRHTMDSAFGRFSQLPELRDGFPWRHLTVHPSTSCCGPAVDASSANTYKLIFDCQGAKPEDISVTLKDKLLTVKVQVVTEGDNSKVVRQLEHQQTLPDGVDGTKLESSLSNDGELSVFAPREPPEGPQTIHVKHVE